MFEVPMKFIIPLICLVTSSFARADLSPKLAEYLNQRQAEFDQIGDSRRIVLEPLAKALATLMADAMADAMAALCAVMAVVCGVMQWPMQWLPCVL